MRIITYYINIAVLLCAAMFCASAQPPRVPEKIVFAGETIRFDDIDRYERMDRELMTFTYMHSSSTLMLKRSGRYFPIIEPILREMGVPDDLKYLMVIESNLNPKACSSAGAAGLWQFMPATARENGLEIREGVDERYNIEKSTRAACRVLKSYYSIFGNWMTVAASYNGGKNGIIKKLEEQKQSNAMELWLAEETSRYMYRILAAKMLFEKPEDFGFHVSKEDYYPYIEPASVIEVDFPIENLVDFAIGHGTTYAKLKAANLWLRDKQLTNSKKKRYRITIPAK